MTGPEQILDQTLAAARREGRSRGRFSHAWAIPAPWLGSQASQPLVAEVEWQLTADGDTRIQAFVTDQPLDTASTTDQTLSERAAAHGAALIDLGAPLALAPVHIPKPWGQEIWYTGIEARGLSEVCTATGSSPLPWVLALAPVRLTGSASELCLLKTLDPLPEPVYGDLYLELHEEKQEVYVVTHVDPQAWPDGVGGIRCGLAPEKRREYADEQSLRQAFLTAVQDYEAVRRRIDARFDERRQTAGIGLNDPVPPALLAQWQQDLPAALRNEEVQKRAVMESFTAIRPLKVGDLVALPTRTPHSLLHGVRVIEFQTPVYERQIIAFAQKVLTQNHWDSAEAIARMHIDAPPDSAPEVLADGADRRVERVVRFDSFNVWRVTLSAGMDLTLPQAPHLLCMGIQGRVQLGGLQCGGLQLGPEQAALIPPGLGGKTALRALDDSLLLLAGPDI